MKVLQQPSFCAYGLNFSVFVVCYERKTSGIFEFGYSKADRESSHGLAVDNFLVFYVLRDFFLRIMGFQPSFLLLHPPLFQVEPQRKEQQLYPYILLSSC